MRNIFHGLEIGLFIHETKGKRRKNYLNEKMDDYVSCMTLMLCGSLEIPLSCRQNCNRTGSLEENFRFQTCVVIRKQKINSDGWTALRSNDIWNKK